MCLKSVPEQFLPLLSRIYSCLDITWEKRKADINSIDPRGILKQWINELPKQHHGFFNFSTDWWNVLDNFMQISSDESMLLCYDLASPSLDTCYMQKQTFGRFGACMFYNIPFFLFEFFAKANRLTWISTKHDNSENQLGCLIKTNNKRTLTMVEEFFKNKEPGKEIYQCWNNLKLLSSAQECKTFIADVEVALTPEQQSDYVWLFTVARTFFDCDDFNKALLVVDQVINQYECMALNAFVLKSKILRKLKRYKDALKIVNKAMKVSPNYDLLQLEKIFICGEINDKEQCLVAIKNYLKVASKNPQWHLFELFKKLK